MSHNTPSFSSTLLDQIYRSTDDVGKDRPPTHFKLCDFKEMADFRRACLVDDWMRRRKDGGNNRKPGKPPLPPDRDADHHLVFFCSTTSTSSDSSGALSSSDTEFFGGGSTTKQQKVSSCFSTRPKPIRTGGGRNINNYKNERAAQVDDHGQKDEEEEELTMRSSKSRALKIYANLKKMKQPISPGGKLTTLINSIFNNSKSKKGSSSSSACSSASSFSRSCLSKYSPKSRQKMREGNGQRTVRFQEESIQLQDHQQHSYYYYSRYVEEGGGSKINSSNKDEEEYDDEVSSESSSDLFELDHLALSELPVYETTYLEEKNRGLMRK